MSDGLSRVLNIRDDFQLCDKLDDLMIDYYGADRNVSKCKAEEQVVILVSYATGIIDNGGFAYLFSGNFKGDPYFARTAAAFRTVKAETCAKALVRALGLFPQAKPPKNIEKRMKIYQGHSFTKLNAIDKQFFRQSGEIPKLLAKYIRENWNAFAHLK